MSVCIDKPTQEQHKNFFSNLQNLGFNECPVGTPQGTSSTVQTQTGGDPDKYDVYSIVITSALVLGSVATVLYYLGAHIDTPCPDYTNKVCWPDGTPTDWSRIEIGEDFLRIPKIVLGLYGLQKLRTIISQKLRGYFGSGDGDKELKKDITTATKVIEIIEESVLEMKETDNDTKHFEDVTNEIDGCISTSTNKTMKVYKVHNIEEELNKYELYTYVYIYIENPEGVTPILNAIINNEKWVMWFKLLNHPILPDIPENKKDIIYKYMKDELQIKLQSVIGEIETIDIRVISMYNNVYGSIYIIKDNDKLDITIKSKSIEADEDVISIKYPINIVFGRTDDEIQKIETQYKGIGYRNNINIVKNFCNNYANNDVGFVIHDLKLKYTPKQAKIIAIERLKSLESKFNEISVHENNTYKWNTNGVGAIKVKKSDLKPLHTDTSVKVTVKLGTLKISRIGVINRDFEDINKRSVDIVTIPPQDFPKYKEGALKKFSRRFFGGNGENLNNLKVMCFTWNTAGMPFCGINLTPSTHSTPSTGEEVEGAGEGVVGKPTWFTTQKECVKPTFLKEFANKVINNNIDIIFVGLQESKKPGSYLMSHTLPYLLDKLGYQLLERERMMGVSGWGIRSALYIRKSIIHKGVNIEISSKDFTCPGFTKTIVPMAIARNKGAVFINLRVTSTAMPSQSTSFTFVNCHLPISVKRLKASYRNTVNHPSSNGVNYDEYAQSQIDCYNALIEDINQYTTPETNVFLLGDFNFRTNFYKDDTSLSSSSNNINVQQEGEWPKYVNTIVNSNQNLKELIENHDEFTVWKKTGVLKGDFIENNGNNPQFLPTYKLSTTPTNQTPTNQTPTYIYKKGEDSKHKDTLPTRAPSWCDRILYKSSGNTITTLNYESFRKGEMTKSDHSGVIGVYDVSTPLGTSLLSTT